MLEVFILLGLSAVAACVALWHAQPGTTLAAKPLRIAQAVVWGHGPVFAGFLLAVIADGSVYTGATVATGGVLYGAAFTAMSYNDKFNEWPKRLVQLSLGVPLTMLAANGLHTATNGRIALVLLHVGLYHYVVADEALERTHDRPRASARPPPSVT